MDKLGLCSERLANPNSEVLQASTCCKVSPSSIVPSLGTEDMAIQALT